MPWSVISIQANGDPKELTLDCTDRQLESAPVLNGDTGSTSSSSILPGRVEALESKED